MTHTPGPWVNDNGLVNGLDPRAGIKGPRSFDIFDAADWPGDEEEAQANAALIAAAPEMLAALKKMLKSFRGRMWIGGVNEIEGVIAKAEGLP
jgi:hypothetical protein